MAIDYSIEVQTVQHGYDRQTCWVQTRAGAIPPHTRVITTQKLQLKGSDVFFDIHSLHSDDDGKTWSAPVGHAELGRRRLDEGRESCPCDGTPAWHAASGTLLATGHLAIYEGDALASRPYPRRTWYSTYDPATRRWTPYDTLRMPDEADQFFNAGAGCTQRVDLPDGTILLPIYFQPRSTAVPGQQRHYHAAIVRCSFDGKTLRYLEHGSPITCPQPRGACEPSLARFGNRFFLTLRNDQTGYVTSGHDGLHFDEPREWCFDDGSPLGNYNTQQHWLIHPQALFLVYTRRGANNDHVFRHRAPLFMAEVDPERLCVIRATERVVVPERGARLGNFGITHVNDQESWVVVAEWMQTNPPDPHDCTVCERYGADNALFISRIRWK